MKIKFYPASGNKTISSSGAATALLAALCAGAPAWAQVAAPGLAPNLIDPAALQRQEMERRRLLEQTPQPAQAPPAVLHKEQAQAAQAAAPAASGVQFTLKQLRFSSSAFLGERELAELAARHTGREYDFAGLAAIVAEVNALYLRHGVLTGRAMLPPQRIENGVVTIELVEARLGQLDVTGNSYTRPGYVASWLASEQGKTLDAQVLEDRIKRFNRVGEMQMEANLRPGASFGLTDIVLAVREPARFQLRVFANNEGSQSIGREQVGIDTAVNGPAGIGDRLALYLTRSRGATLGSLSYSVPVNRWGGHLSATYGNSATDVIAGPYRALDITGTSHSLQLAMVQPVWQNEAWWFDLAASAGTTKSENLTGGVLLSKSTIHNQTASATVAGVLANRSLNLALTATHASATAAATAQREFNVRQLTASWVENLGTKQFLLLRASMQDSNDAVLAPSLLFQLGGGATVRGYEVGVLSGDRGYLFNLEWHRTISDSVGAYLFHDTGEVRTVGLPHQSAKSVGAGLDWQWGAALRANVTAGYALDKVQADQANWRVTGRLSYDF